MRSAQNSSESWSASASEQLFSVETPDYDSQRSSAAEESVFVEPMSPEPKKPLLPTDVSAASYRKYSLLMLYIVLVVTGLLMTQPLLIFAQEKFFNASGGECVTDAERDTDDCKRASGRLAGVTGARCLRICGCGADSLAPCTETRRPSCWNAVTAIGAASACILEPGFPLHLTNQTIRGRQKLPAHLPFASEFSSSMACGRRCNSGHRLHQLRTLALFGASRWVRMHECSAMPSCGGYPLQLGAGAVL